MKTPVKIGVGLGTFGLVVIGAFAAQLAHTPVSPTPTGITAEERTSAPNQVPVTPSAPKAPIKQQNCHPSYSGCLKPDASDYDCAGGSGNGPYYTEAVRVLGSDVFGLDRDGDGWGCE